MKKKFIWILVSCLMVVSLLVTSCGGGATDEEEDVNGGEEEINGEEDEVNGGEEEDTTGKDMVLNSVGKLVEKPKYGGTVNIASTIDVRGFDEAYTTPYMTYSQNLTHDELYTGDWTKGPAGTGEITWLLRGTFFPQWEVPCLATGYELPDDETIIFHIRQGVHFHDKPPVNGREMNAHDVVYSINRLFTIPGSYLAGTYAGEDAPKSITAIDDWTVEIKVPPLQQGALLYACSDYARVVSQEMAEEWGGDFRDWRAACGTGPYMLTDYVPVSSIIFERNPDYWRKHPLFPEDAMPYPDGVKWLVVPDSSTTLAAFRTGKIDARGVGWDDANELMKSRPDLEWIVRFPHTGYNIFMRCDNPELPWYDINVRRALAMAVNHPSIIEDYYDGHAELLCSPVAPFPEFADMYVPLEELPEETQKLFGYYPDEARDLLAKAGYPNGFECNVIATGEGLLAIVKDNWADIGVTLNIDVKTVAVWQSIGVSGRHEEMIYFYSGNDVPLKFNQYRPDAYLNCSMINDERCNEAYTQICENVLDWDKSAAVIKGILPYCHSQAWWIELASSNSYQMWWPWLKGYGGEVTDGYFNEYGQWNYVWIDTELKEVMTGSK